VLEDLVQQHLPQVVAMVLIHHLAWCQQPLLVEAAVLLVLVAQILVAQQAALVAVVRVAHLVH
jgi:hypothetical protein